MSNYQTLTYSPKVEGWPSFYTFNPDLMSGMNQYFYTWKGGNLFVHNTNQSRNTFYEQFSPSIIKSVINDIPLENKIFKTLSLEGDSAWQAQLKSDIQESGFIEKDWFERKEGTYFAFIRTAGTDPHQYELRSANGVGRSEQLAGTPTAPILRFSLSLKIGSIVSIGDSVFFALPPNYEQPEFAGIITDIRVNLQGGINEIELDASMSGAITIPIQDAYILTLKDTVAESYGILGHYCIFEIENDNQDKTELFVVTSDIMKSFP